MKVYLHKVITVNKRARLIFIDIHNLLCAMSSRKVRETKMGLNVTRHGPRK